MAGQRPPKPPIKCNKPYLCSDNLFIFKIPEVACLLATVVLASQFTGPDSLIYIQIVGALGAVTCLAWVFLYCCNLNARFPEFFPILMFVYHFVLGLLTIGVCVCCAVLWPQFRIDLYPQFAVSTILSFIASVLFIIEALLNVLMWRGAINEIITFPCSPWKYEPAI